MLKGKAARGERMRMIRYVKEEGGWDGENERRVCRCSLSRERGHPVLYISELLSDHHLPSLPTKHHLGSLIYLVCSKSALFVPGLARLRGFPFCGNFGGLGRETEGFRVSFSGDG